MSPDIPSLLAQIDEEPDKLHSDSTPAVEALIEIGEPALAPVLELMLSPNRETRMRAQKVLEGVTLRLHGFRPGHGWDDRSHEDDWRRFWKSLGGLDWDAPEAERAATVARWREWLRAKESS